MPRRYDTYCFNEVSIGDARSLVERLLDIRLAPHDSGYYSETYYAHELAPGREIKLYRNEDGFGAPINTDHRDCPVILKVSDYEDMDGIRAALTDGRDEPILLSSAELPDRPPTEP